MTLDLDTAVGCTIPTQVFRWDETTVRRYHDAVGLRTGRPGVLPTFAMTAPGAFGVASPEFHYSEPPEVRFPGIRLRLATLLHLEQELVVPAPLPDAASTRCHGEVVDVEDRGTAAVLVQRTRLIESTGSTLAFGTSRIHARGEGGRGSAPGAARTALPDRATDVEICTATTDSQAVRYHECGLAGPLHGNVHTDAAFARAAGLLGPILQGACTYGMVCAAVVEAVLDSEVSRVRGFTARFQGVVYPGESLRTRIWCADEDYVFATSVPEREDKPVLSGMLQTE